MNGNAAQQKFSAITTSHGLSDNNINDIIQDQYGFLWIATEAGLNRYDGKEIVSYSTIKNMNGLSDDDVVTFYLSPSNILWLGTENGGLIRFDINKDKFSNTTQAFTSDGQLLLLDGKHLSSNTVHAITQDDDGLLYVGTEGGGLNIIDLSSNQISYYFVDDKNNNSLCHNEIKSIFRDSQGMIWLGTVGGLNRYDPMQKSFICYRHESSNGQSLPNNEVVAIVEDNQHNLWIGTEGGGVSYFDREDDTFSTYAHQKNDRNSLSNDEIQSLHLSHDNILWVATAHGLNRFDPAKGLFSQFFYDTNNNDSLSSNVISALYQDKSGILWIGTEGGGINKLHPSMFAINSKEQYPAAQWMGQAITSIYKHNDDITWVGSENLGLFSFNGQTHTYENYQCLTPFCDEGDVNEITAIAGTDKNVWIGTDGQGLIGYSVDEQRFTPIALPLEAYASVSSLYLGKNNELWIGTEENKIFKLNTATQHLEVIKLTPLITLKAEFGNEVRCLLQDSNGNLWVGTEEYGVIFIDQQSQSIKHYYKGAMENFNISNNAINSITEDVEGRIWIATSLGINVVSPADNSLSKYFVEDGLISNNVIDIIIDDADDLWLTTNKGIMRYQSRTQRFSHYDSSDDLLNEQYVKGAVFKDSKGLLYFGGNITIDVIKPSLAPKNPQAPTTVITKLRLFDQEIMATNSGLLNQPIFAAKELNFNHKEYVFSLQFSALDFTAPEKNQYAYYLAGFDQDWRYVASQNSATYTNLPAGDYTFYVKGTNNDGVWSELPTQLAITIAAAPWKTWWAYCSYLLLISLVIYAFISIKLKRHSDAFALLREREEKQRLKKNYEMEQRFTSNVAHELRTPLAELISMSEIAIMWPDDAKITADFYQNTLDAAKQMHQVVNNLLALARCERGLIKLNFTPLNLQEEIDQAWYRYHDEWQDKNLTIDIKGEPLAVISSSQAEFALVLNNILSNAIEYCPRGSEIMVEISLQDKDGYSISFANVTEEQLDLEDLQLMFQRLWRKDLSRSSEKHFGLGMSLIKAYTEMFAYPLTVAISKDGLFIITVKNVSAANGTGH